MEKVSSIPIRYQHVPGWLARKYPFVAALEDNPLYLAMTGQKYCSRCWGRLWQRRKRWFEGGVSATFWVVLVIDVVVALYFYAWWWIVVAASMVGKRNCTADLRAEARSGRLLDFYLSMSPRQIVDGLAGARLFTLYRFHLALLVVAGASAIVLTPALFFADTYGTKTALAALSALSYIALACVPSAFIGGAIGCYHSIGKGMVMASEFSLSRKSRNEIAGYLEAIGHTFMAGCLPIVCTIFLAGAGIYLLMELFGLSSPGWCLPPIILAGIVFNLMHIQAVYDSIFFERNRAIRLTNDNLALVIEKNPPTGS